MTLVQMLSIYITLNVLIAFGVSALFLFSFILRKTKINLSSKLELELHYFVIAVIFVVFLIPQLIPHKEIFQPTLKIWSGESMKSFMGNNTNLDKNHAMNVSIGAKTATIQVTKITIAFFSIVFGSLCFGFVKFWKDARALIRIKRQSFVIRKFKLVSILANDALSVPFSYWLLGRSYVVLPSHFISNRESYKIAIAHELQHHRQHDTVWVYVFLSLRVFCFINPFIHLWNRWISEIQEFACDETLVNKNKVSLQAYARCLVNVVEMAQTAINQERLPGCATGLAFLIERTLIKRRIEKMVYKKSIYAGRTLKVAVGALVGGLLAVSAFASQNFVQDRRVTLSQAEEMAKVAQHATHFPVVVNDRVLIKLNQYLGTAQGRAHMQNSLQRMENYREKIALKLKQYNLPKELLAVPLVESGYQNLEQGSDFFGAGIWMFIAQTAREFGLRVDTVVDERLNVDLLTDAAMRLLLSNKLRFNDWQLALLAYNLGGTKVQEAIDTVGSRDAWDLVRAGYKGDNDYLADVMATILIMQNPSSIQ